MTTRRTTPAQLIKAELKKAFPWVKFSCKYKSFSWWDSVDVDWKGWPLTTDVEAIANQYEAWYFDWMEDLYHYTNDRPCNETAKYVMCNREDDEDEVKEWINELWEDCVNAALDFWKREWKWSCDIRDHIKWCIMSHYDYENNMWENYSNKKSLDNREKAYAIANYLMKVNNLW